MDETQQLQQEIEALKKQIKDLVYRVNTHTHTGFDLTKRIELRDIYLENSNDFFFQLPSGTADPSPSVLAGALAVVSGDLKIYNGSAWEKVGLQT